MAIPQTIRVAYEEDYHTGHIGQYGEDQQFMAFVVATLPKPLPADWQRPKRWYAVLHTFDAEGAHLETKSWFAGVTADGERQVCERAAAKRDEMIGALGEVERDDIDVQLFSTTIDGHVFGLVDTSDPELGDRVTLQPNDLLFTPPWNGSYDT